VSQRLEVFSRTVYTYNYGMTCYEILIGKFPFENHPLRKNHSLLSDLVINQHLCPKIPKYVEDWICELLKTCWESNSMIRPIFGEILDLVYSMEVKSYKDYFKEDLW
jgi:serine/threonine protein kinase